ncbi:hypothetical protein DDB_G0276001 [Dictyostelium discoideum AX4]|uniref:Uncharacterized protein n=1 Tax=Dictyostelium discoideum TaxID=44689 RepID=Q552L0_DICDI|nr:hypothetical protein DDB_G0276001 [Dictyostelium discoideum AX4]EAL69457.1 hypothetical protein DDB_G0276001 [Dictyostelium discoideum AX4]|eukprot:XP_643372.1 hypothetical protein DDB_G0276001 [Dictyostelium discoideum AX4]
MYGSSIDDFIYNIKLKTKKKRVFKSIISLSNKSLNVISKSLVSNDSNLNSINFSCNSVSNLTSTTFFTRPNFVNY